MRSLFSRLKHNFTPVSPEEYKGFLYLSAHEPHLVASLINELIADEEAHQRDPNYVIRGSIERQLTVKRAWLHLQSDHYIKFRVERVVSPVPALRHLQSFIVYKNGHVYELVTSSAEVAQHYAAASGTFPVPQARRSYSAILIGAMIKHGQYGDGENILSADLCLLVQAIIELEFFVNGFIVGVPVEEQKAHFQNAFAQFKGKLPSGFAISAAMAPVLAQFGEKIAHITNDRDFETLVSALPLSFGKLVQENLVNFIREITIAYLDFLKNTHQSSWNDEWDLFSRQVQADLMKPVFYPAAGPIPTHQLHFAKMLVEPLNSGDRERGLLDESHELVILKSNPLAEEVGCFLRAVAGDRTPREHLSLFRFYTEQLPEQVILLGRRLYYTAWDVPQMLPQMVTGGNSHYSSRSEGERLTYMGYPHTNLLPFDSIIKSAVLTSSAQLIELLKVTLSPRKLADYSISAIQSIMYMVTVPFISVYRAAITFKVDIFNQPGAFDLALTPRIVNACADNMIEHLEAQVASLKAVYLNENSPLFQAAELLSSLIKAAEKIKHKEYGSSTNKEELARILSRKLADLARLRFCFDILYAQQVNEQVIHVEHWEQALTPGILEFMPTEVVESLVNYLVSGVLVGQRFAAKFACITSVLGISGVPLLGQWVDNVNAVLTGKSLHGSGLMGLGVMGLLFFKAGLVVGTTLSKEESILYEILAQAAHDPLKIVAAVGAMVLVAMGQATQAYLDALRLASCGLRISRLGGILWVFETCFIELYETRLAKFPWFEALLLVFKQLGLVHSFFVKDGRMRLVLEGDNEKIAAVAVDICLLMEKSNKVSDDEEYRSVARDICTRLEAALGDQTPVVEDGEWVMLEVEPAPMTPLDRVLQVILLRDFGPNGLIDRLFADYRRKLGYKEVALQIRQIGWTDYSINQALALLYNVAVESERSRIANFLNHAIRLSFYMQAYVVRGFFPFGGTFKQLFLDLPPLARALVCQIIPRAIWLTLELPFAVTLAALSVPLGIVNSLKKTIPVTFVLNVILPRLIQDVGDNLAILFQASASFVVKYQNVLKWPLNVAALTAFIWWVYVYDSSVVAHPEHGPSIPQCMAAGYGDHELVEECMSRILRCNYVQNEYPSWLGWSTFLVKIAGGLVSLIGGALNCINWNSADTSQARNMTQNYWLTELMRLSETTLFSIYGLCMYLAVIADDYFFGPELRTIAMSIAQLCMWFIMCCSGRSDQRPVHQNHVPLVDEDVEPEIRFPNQGAERAARRGFTLASNFMNSLFANPRPDATQNELMLSLLQSETPRP